MCKETAFDSFVLNDSGVHTFHISGGKSAEADQSPIYMFISTGVDFYV